MHLDLDDTNRVIRLVQLTDCHLGTKAGERLLGLNTDESFSDVLDIVEQEQSHIDLLLATGDLANYGRREAYQRFLKLVRGRLKAPLAWLPGNHDSPDILKAAADESIVQRHVTLGKWMVVMLDTHVPGYVHGDLRSEELEFLAKVLSDHRDYYTLVCLHHQPVKVGSDWIDEQMVRSADKFFEILDQHSQVKGLLWGHVHQEFAAKRKSVHLWATPSTCIQFEPKSKDFAVGRALPGYRWLALHPDGNIDTGVSRVENKSYPIDFSSGGY